ncbi:MAG: sigma-54-dependent Fis family transcriptional regulator [Candidatus Latescibacterota bacterium]|nr:MAG: sigma-54-dependent Fis family transcriptional regulator [Candidatus Latescibacterota bacterium]
MPGRVLIVDDEKNIRRTIEMIHRNAGWEAASAPGVDEALSSLDKAAYDVVYLDLSMPGKDGIEGLREIKSRRPDQIVVILTGQGTIERAVEAIKLGAFDFLEKDCGKEKILLTSKNALEYGALAAENKVLKRKISGRREFLGKSRPVSEILDQVNKVAPTSARVLIMGESGTGKELIAQAIHDRSQRKDGPFIKVNCAAIPEELIEAELFGSVKGAYTGASESREGKFEAAHGGTLFLDEIGDMSLRVQTKVLRALQEGEIERVGSNKTINVDVRVITATNKDLAKEVAAGRVREDLYFRLNVVPIVAAPLRERPDDIPLLAEAFLNEYCDEYGLPRKTLDPQVVELLSRYPWPGNVRELKNQVERMVIMSSGKMVRVSDLSSEIRMGKPSVAGAGKTDQPPQTDSAGAVSTAQTDSVPSTHAGPETGGIHFELGAIPLQEARKQFEREMILRALERNEWNVSRAADELGLERTNLHKKIKTYGLTRGSQ